jgi:hypothetical protein
VAPAVAEFAKPLRATYVPTQERRWLPIRFRPAAISAIGEPGRLADV